MNYPHLTMSDDRERRIDDALSSLVDALLPVQQTEDNDDVTDDRREHALDIAKSTITRYSSPQLTE